MKEKPDTREALLAATVKVIDEAGPAAVRVRDISAAAGVTPASLYHFFGDRENLVVAAQAQRYSSRYLRPLDEVKDGLEKCRNKREFRNFVKRQLLQMLDSSHAPDRFTRLNVLGSAENRPDLLHSVLEAQNIANTTFADLFAPAQRKGWIPQKLNLADYFAWYAGVILGRVLVENDANVARQEEWNRLTIEAVVGTLVAPD